MPRQIEITLPAFNRGFHIITRHIFAVISPLPDTGLINVFLHHTSAGLCIVENADSDVLHDLNTSFNHIAPEQLTGYMHSIEGPDDMPAHIKSVLTGVSLNIPISNGQLKLGTWQGLCLCEFRNHGGPRKITLTILS